MAAPVLRPTRNRSRGSDRLARRWQRVGLPGVLADLDRVAVPADVPGEAAVEGLAWEQRDVDDQRWWPQGVACVDGDDVLMASWYAKRDRLLRTEGVRVSVVDRRDRDRPRYAHVLLVVPRPGPLPVAPLRLHAGGIAVVGGLLLVADTLGGVRVFALDDVLRVPGGTRGGYRFVLPQRRRLRVPLRAGLRFSFLSVDESDGAPALVVGEYRRQGATPRLVRYPLDLSGRGVAAPTEVHEQQPPRMQGVAVHRGTWWVSASTGPGRPGDLHVGRPGAFVRHRGVLPPSPEDLDWSDPGRVLWSLSEHPGQRWLFRVDADRWT